MLQAQNVANLVDRNRQQIKRPARCGGLYVDCPILLHVEVEPPVRGRERVSQHSQWSIESIPISVIERVEAYPYVGRFNIHDASKIERDGGLPCRERLIDGVLRVDDAHAGANGW